MTDIEKLLKRIDEIKFKYPENMENIRGKEVSGIAFFPGGKGTYENDDNLSNKEIMILGQDFGTADSLKKVLKRDDVENDRTWRPLLRFLKKAGIDRNNCFYTNAIMGVRGTGKIIGRAPAFNCPDFIKQCQDFFLYQLEIQKPKIILVLGKEVAQFVSPLFDENNLSGWKHIHNFKTLDTDGKPVIEKATFKNKIESTLVLLAHPSMPNARHRQYDKGVKGEKAQFAMVSEALNFNKLI